MDIYFEMFQRRKARHFFLEWTSKFQAVSCSVDSGKLHETLELKVAWTLEEQETYTRSLLWCTYGPHLYVPWLLTNCNYCWIGSLTIWCKLHIIHPNRQILQKFEKTRRQRLLPPLRFSGDHRQSLFCAQWRKTDFQPWINFGDRMGMHSAK